MEKTRNQNTLIQDLRAKVKCDFNVKHTYNSTMLFVQEKEDHERVLQNIKGEKIAHVTYTSREDKSHAFVIRELANGITDQTKY